MCISVRSQGVCRVPCCVNGVMRGVRSRFGRGAELLGGVTLGVRQVVTLTADAARPSQKGCLAIAGVGRWKCMASEEV